MRSDAIMDEEALAALARANEIEAESVAKIDQLIALSKQRDEAGRLTKAARTAQQALSSPTLTSTVPSVTLRRSINPSLDRAIDDLQRTEIAHRSAVATVRLLQARKALFEGARGTPRKRVVEDHDVAPEEMHFIREMRRMQVPVSAMDQLTAPELHFVASLFVDKQRDMRHRMRAGPWWMLVQAGLLNISSEAFNDEERAAILAARPIDEESDRLAYEALCDLAGRKLDISPTTAHFLVEYARHSTEDEPLGAFEKNVERVHSDQQDADAERLLNLLGLPKSEIRRAFRLMRRPALFSYLEEFERRRAADEQREAAYRELVDRHLPAARQALAERHEAERRRERELVGADELGMFDTDAALQRLGADEDYDEEAPEREWTIIRQVREGTFFRDREKERSRTVRVLAAHLVHDEDVRRKVAEMGIVLPDLDEGNVQLVAPRPAEPAAEAPAPVMEQVAEAMPDLDEGNVQPAAPRPPEPSVEAPARVVEQEVAAMPVIESPAAIASAATAADFGLPADITPEAAQAYYAIAKDLAVNMGDWKSATFGYGSADRDDPADVAGLRQWLEESEERGALDDVCSRYLAIWRSKSLADADDYLIDVEARKLVKEVANGYDFEVARKNAGFPRRSQ